MVEGLDIHIISYIHTLVHTYVHTNNRAAPKNPVVVFVTVINGRFFKNISVMYSRGQTIGYRFHRGYER